MSTIQKKNSAPAVRARFAARATCFLSCTVASILAVAGPASAGDIVPTEWLDLGSGPLGPNDFFEAGFVISDLEYDGVGVAGFEVRFDYSEPIDDRSWASDVQVIVEAPAGENFIVGGLTRLADADVFWSFQGEGSDAPGRYGDSGDDILLPWKGTPLALGTYNVRFTNDWETDPNANLYESVQVRFYLETVPAPGAIVLLGLAGVSRRRRRS